MKSLMIAIAAVCATAAIPAFAQSNAPAATQQLASVSVPGGSGTSTLASAGQWVPPYGQATQGKTRAQVYRELIQARQDGQLAYLNSTLYAHN